MDRPAAGSEDLMLAVRGGSREAFERLFELYRGPIWRFFRRRVRDGATAEDLAQSVFTALLEAASRYQARGTFRSYLFGIAFNILEADRRKSAARSADPFVEADVSNDSSDPDAGLWVRAALARLDSGDREIVMLREYEGLSYQEIAELTLVPLNTVRSRLFRARTALRELLAGDVHKQEQAR